MTSDPVYVLYASATGNAEHIAKDLSSKIPGSKCAEMDSWKKTLDLSKSCLLLVVASTTGNGDPPENGSRLARLLKRKTTAADLFANVQFAVLGLGDTNYDQFCAVGKSLDKRLNELGGSRWMHLACADEATGLEETVEPWVAAVLEKLSKCRDNLSIDSNAAPIAESSPPIPQADPSKSTLDASIAAVGEIPTAALEKELFTSSVGVDIVRNLFSLKSGEDLPPVDSTSISCLINHSVSSCELYNANEKVDASSNSNGLTVSNILSGDQSISTVSTGFLFTHLHPFQSAVQKARYLTTTSIAAAEEIVRDNISDFATRLSIYDRHFGVEFGNSSKSDIDKLKRVIELTLTLPDDMTIEYAPGDSLGILVENPSKVVMWLLSILARQGVHPSTTIILNPSPASGGPPSTATVLTVEQLVKTLDVSSVVSKRVLTTLAHYATGDEALALRHLACKSSGACQSYLEEQHITLMDILELFPSCQSISWKFLLGMLTSLTPRYYSVSSSPLVLENAVTIAFSVVDYFTPSLVLTDGRECGRRRVRGVATRFLEALVSPSLITSHSNQTSANGISSISIPIFPKPSSDFRMPASTHIPLILIGPGTGIAPFVGFLSHRRAMIQEQSRHTSSTATSVVEGNWRGGYDIHENELHLTKNDVIRQRVRSESITQNSSSIDVYFGCRHEDHDWLYRDELTSFQANGTISELHTAFSRDSGPSKTYVQHIMQRPANAKRIAELILHQDTRVYLCGDGNFMAKDVQDTIMQILAPHLLGGIDESQSYFEKMKEERRFLMDIWS